jgi:NDP-sugar pyrophosphorylase family protein
LRAKPAIPVAGEPMIRRITAWLVQHGIPDLVMNLHHHPQTLTAVLGDGTDLGARVRYSWEQPHVLGSAGGPRHALPIVDADPFLIVNGDTLTDVDVAAVAADHEASGALVTLALVPNREFDRYGGVAVDDSGNITGFTRRGADSTGTWHFIGVQAVAASVFASLPAGVPLNSIGGVYDELIRSRRGAVRAFRTEAAFWDVGTPADYLRTSRAFSATGVDTGRRAAIDPSARITDSILWDDVEIGPRASLHACIVTDGVRVPEGASYQRSILVQRDERIEATPIDAD